MLAWRGFSLGGRAIVYSPGEKLHLDDLKQCWRLFKTSLSAKRGNDRLTFLRLKQAGRTFGQYFRTPRAPPLHGPGNASPIADKIDEDARISIAPYSFMVFGHFSNCLLNCWATWAFWQEDRLLLLWNIFQNVLIILRMTILLSF